MSQIVIRSNYLYNGIGFKNCKRRWWMLQVLCLSGSLTAVLEVWREEFCSSNHKQLVQHDLRKLNFFKVLGSNPKFLLVYSILLKIKEIYLLWWVGGWGRLFLLYFVQFYILPFLRYLYLSIILLLGTKFKITNLTKTPQETMQDPTTLAPGPHMFKVPL